MAEEAHRIYREQAKRACLTKKQLIQYHYSLGCLYYDYWKIYGEETKRTTTHLIQVIKRVKQMPKADHKAAILSDSLSRLQQVLCFIKQVEIEGEKRKNALKTTPQRRKENAKKIVADASYIASAYIKKETKEDYWEALHYLTIVLNTIEDGKIYQVAKTNTRLGEVYTRLEISSLAREHLLKALVLFAADEAHYRAEIFDVYTMLIKACLKERAFEEEIFYIRKARELTQKYPVENRKEILAYLKKHHSYAEQEKVLLVSYASTSQQSDQQSTKENQKS